LCRVHCVMQRRQSAGGAGQGVVDPTGSKQGVVDPTCPTDEGT